METLTVGSYTLTWLRGGVTHLDGGAMFGVVPKPLWSKKYPVNDKNQIELRTDPILIQGNGKTMLIEAGIGNNRFTEKQKRIYGITEESYVEKDLQKLGLTTADIDAVLMTHMHFDHASGLVKWQNGQEVPAYENAVIYVSETEWEEMKNPNIRSKSTYWEQNWKAVQQHVQTYSEKLEPAPGVVLTKTGGHSKGMSIVTIEQSDEMVIHMADNMGTHAHQNVLWVMAYDDYPLDSIALKQKYMNLGYTRQAWFTFYHDYKYRAIQYDREGNIQTSVTKQYS
ncbi:Glyoxylase, beta-lactamase superfamily II [Alteribacillus persepolensis]|uniref:Glyoxylase, beta-lactamase superfamily II n=1 Tax=Alteribacillus persepolensis TaxID=568899 RepID=A0A1G8E4S7_9BACI|nr:MBL fold metallo-hydrolase [Alteribacillus persepolensis]SDH64864.1 Glyoxylase, beta-lactamase superfamily II [Alteribacillus persepolensis]